jgi:uncharacterized protein (DUF2141 family)
MIRRLSLVALAALVLVPVSASAAGPLGSDAAACTTAQGPAILATIVGLKDRVGNLKLELYPATDDDFLKDDNVLLAQGKVFRRITVAAPQAGAAVSLCIRVPRPGRYALLFTHNRDGKNKFNIWNDGAGITSNAKIGRGKPKVDESIVNVGNVVTTVTIHAQYLHGFGGFSPAG